MPGPPAARSQRRAGPTSAELQEELEHQKSIEDMREAFATAAEELVAWSATMKRQIATSDSGPYSSSWPVVAVLRAAPKR